MMIPHPIYRIFMTAFPIVLALAITATIAVFVPPIRDALGAARDEYGRFFWGFVGATSIMATVFTLLMGVLLWDAHAETVNVVASNDSVRDSESSGR